MILDNFGISTDDLESQLGSPTVPVTPGRVAHIDADFMAYIVAADTRAEINGEKPMRNITHKFGQIKSFANTIARYAGAEKYVLHLTPTGSTKGGRAQQVVQQEYQGNRKSKEVIQHLIPLRSYMIDECNAIPHMDQEADDGLVQAMLDDPINNIIVSDDKDLLMAPGLHYVPRTKEFMDVAFEDFGKLDVTDKGKVVGYGPAFFFLQLIMGDTADNIKGLPLTQGAKKGVTVGPKRALALMDGVDNVKDAFNHCRSLFNYAADGLGWEFKHWKTGAPVTANQAMLGDMQALWMRRDKNPLDCIEFIKENT